MLRSLVRHPSALRPSAPPHQRSGQVRHPHQRSSRVRYPHRRSLGRHLLTLPLITLINSRGKGPASAECATLIGARSADTFFRCPHKPPVVRARPVPLAPAVARPVQPARVCGGPARAAGSCVCGGPARAAAPAFAVARPVQPPPVAVASEVVSGEAQTFLPRRLQRWSLPMDITLTAETRPQSR